MKVKLKLSPFESRSHVSPPKLALGTWEILDAQVTLLESLGRAKATKTLKLKQYFRLPLNINLNVKKRICTNFICKCMHK